MRITSLKRSLGSFKDFFKEYLLIVLGVATALVANAWITGIEHTQAAAAASTQMDVELQATLDSIQDSLKKNQANIQSLGLLGKLIADDLRDGVPTAVINAHIQANRKKFQAGSYFPDTPTSAWDVAVANQAVSWIASDRLQRYSKAYNDLRTLKAWEQGSADVTVDYPRVADFETDLGQGRDVDPLALLHAVEQVRLALRTDNGNIASVQADLQAALRKPRQ